MSIYTIVAYRPDGVDTCRGCVMARSSSDFECRAFSSMEEAAQFWATKRLESSTSAREYCSWEITALIDGLDCDSWWTLKGQDCDDDEPPFEELQRMADQAFNALVAARAEAARQEQLRAEAQAAAEREAAQLKKTAAEKAQLKALLAQYGPPTKEA